MVNLLSTQQAVAKNAGHNPLDLLHFCGENTTVLSPSRILFCSAMGLYHLTNGKKSTGLTQNVNDSSAEIVKESLSQ